jgi:hypothetical protein
MENVSDDIHKIDFTGDIETFSRSINFSRVEIWRLQKRRLFILQKSHLFKNMV